VVVLGPEALDSETADPLFEHGAQQGMKSGVLRIGRKQRRTKGETDHHKHPRRSIGCPPPRNHR
jgi:hypothetical protein